MLGLTEIGKNQKSLLMRQLFPLHYEMLFIMVLATFSKYSDIRAGFLRKQEDKKQQRKGSSLPDSQKDYADALHQDGFSSSATEDQVSDDKIEKNSATEQVQEKDETLRGRFYSFFQICYTGIKWALQKGLNFATIHSTKIAQAMLFSVTALDPNIFNGFLFVLFLAISMGNNSQMLPLWRFTLVAISLVLFSQYSLRVFASNDYLLSVKHHQKNNVLCLSGLIRCEDDASIETTFSNLELSNLKLYLPYYGLLITFICGYFILTSENYKNLMDEYIDREVHL